MLVVADEGTVRLYARTRELLEELEHFETNGSIGGIDVGDIDGDGEPEIAVSNTIANHVDVFSRGRTDWSTLIRLETPGSPSEILLRNLDDDTRLDLIATLPASGELAVYRQRGDGSFADPQLVSVGDGPAQVAVGNVIGDANRDLVVCRESAAEISVFAGLPDGNFADAVSFRVAGKASGIHVSNVIGDAFDEILVASRSTLVTFDC